MKQGVAETRVHWLARRRRRSALLSAIAALLTAAFFLPKVLSEEAVLARFWYISRPGRRV